MTTRQFAELQRQTDVIETHDKNMQVNKAVELFVETIVLEFIDIDEEPTRWHDLYSKECELFGIMSKFDKSQSAEYKKRIAKEAFKWRIAKVKGFFCLNENHEFNDEGHGYIDTQIEWGGTRVNAIIYRKVDRQPEFFVDLYDGNRSRESRIDAEKDMEERFHKYISNQ
jgi:hypothetical protein